ncbi:MAG: extracellular solute-binding protein [Alcaligenaceae bacterium]|nr:extracellular solute-binding protein [Alcaligenaceae bacterium]
MKKSRFIVLVVVAMLLMVAGTTFAQKITFLTHPTLYMAMGESEAFERFTAETGIEVEVVRMPTTQIREVVMMEFIAKTGRYDVINVSNTIFTTEVLKHLEPLDKYIEEDPPEDFEDIFPALTDMFRYPVDDPKTYAIPFRTGTALIFYRTDLFEEYGIDIPTNWDEFKEAARKLTLDLDGDGQTDIYGYCIKGGDTHTVSEDFQRYLYAFGGQILSDDMSKCVINEEPGVAAVELMKFFVDEKLTHPDFLTWIRDDLIVAQQQGRVAMAMQFSPYFGLMRDPEQSLVHDKISAFPMPTVPGVPVGRTYNPTWALAIDGNSKNKEAAWQLIKFLVNKENQYDFALNHANGPVRRSVIQEPEYREFIGIADALEAGLAVGTSNPPHPAFAEMEEIWGQEIIQVLMGQKTPKSAMDDAAARIDRILRRYQ